MNKIVCGLCGASYPESVPQCPNCGTAHTSTDKTTTGSESGYVRVKGGRFSHNNVRKRNAGKGELPRVIAPAQSPKKEKAPKEPKPVKEVKPVKESKPAPKAQPAERPVRNRPVQKKPPKEKGRGTNVVLALIALLLVLAILLAFAYLVKGFIDERRPTGTTPSTSTAPIGTGGNEIPCTSVVLALSEKTFTSPKDKFYLSVKPMPENTTDTVWYESADERVAIVDEKGIVYPVADGVTIITVHCGEFTAECTITVQIGVEPEEPTKPTDPTDPTNPTDPVVELVLNRSEFTLNGFGDYWDLYTAGEIDVTTIIWSSSDETIAKVENGRVTAVGNGTVIITAEYMGQVATCSVRCTNVVVTRYELQTRYGATSDFTLEVGKTIVLFMVDKETGLRIPAEELLFTLSKEGIVSIDANGKITALAKGTVTVTVTYGDFVLKCKVRVTNPKT